MFPNAISNLFALSLSSTTCSEPESPSFSVSLKKGVLIAIFNCRMSFIENLRYEFQEAF